MKRLPFLLAILAASIGICTADESEKSTEKLVFKTEWRGERITLPPGFAPEMKLKGVEEIRFAPGMFKPEADDFFSYVFVIAVDEDQKLSEETIQKELLAYYRGLASSVMKGKNKDVDTSKFKLELEKAKEATNTAASVTDKKSVQQYKGKLDWIEPFATTKPQVLHLESQSWTDPKTEAKLPVHLRFPQGDQRRNGNLEKAAQNSQRF